MEQHGPLEAQPGIDLHEDLDQDRGYYSAVALCREGWVEGLPGLGGTRCMFTPSTRPIEAIPALRREVVRLARTMKDKNTLLRRVEDHLIRREPSWTGRTRLFSWNGAKSVVWIPFDPELERACPGENLRRSLTPARLMRHGRLIQSLEGEYIGAEDMYVGRPELMWIERSTSYTIGMGCLVDTGDATATGVLAAILTAARCSGLLGDRDSGLPAPGLAPDPDALQGLSILILGAGKVGLPRLKLLSDRGARCTAYHPNLTPGRIDPFFTTVRQRGAAVGDEHRELLEQLDREGRLFADEQQALSQPDVRIVSPNGGNTGWLTQDLPGTGSPRARFLAETKRRGRGGLSLIVGAGNSQAAGGTEARLEALEWLDSAAITFVPDALVSPGGVVSVSHEMRGRWQLEEVRADAFDIVHHGLTLAYEGAEHMREPNSMGLYQAHQVMMQSEEMGGDWRTAV